jgi:hypothetical protein
VYSVSTIQYALCFCSVLRADTCSERTFGCIVRPFWTRCIHTHCVHSSTTSKLSDYPVFFVGLRAPCLCWAFAHIEIQCSLNSHTMKPSVVNGRSTRCGLLKYSTEFSRKRRRREVAWARSVQSLATPLTVNEVGSGRVVGSLKTRSRLNSVRFGSLPNAFLAYRNGLHPRLLRHP